MFPILLFQAYTFSSQALSRFLQSLLYIYPTECRISDTDYDDPNYLSTKVIIILTLIPQ